LFADKCFALLMCIFLLSLGAPYQAWAQNDTQAASNSLPHTIDVGSTGFANKRPVVASACPKGCPWGDLGKFVHQSMLPFGYDVVLCENCNRSEGPRIVSTAAYAPPLTQAEMSLGTMNRVNARIDFGITTTFYLTQAVTGTGAYEGRAMKNLRLIARIEDPYYLLVAVKASSGVTDIQQLVDQKRPLKILASGPASVALLNHYGLTKTKVEEAGGSIIQPIDVPDDTPFDIFASQFAAPTNNPESAFWTTASQKYDLRFLDLPEPVLAELAGLPNMTRVTAPCCLLRGIVKPIETVGWSGDAVFGRADMPDDVVYDVARALDRNRAGLRWYVRPFSYNSDTVWRDSEVPLHPGAARYYRERGYMPQQPEAANAH
jgi:hypothetical protein